MLDKIDYVSHKTYQPPYYLRQYENDLPDEPDDSSYAETTKRAALIALPFLSLYQPLGKVISVAMGASRVVTSGLEAVNADLSQTAIKVLQVALAVLALIGTLYHFTLGLYITTGTDIITNLAQILEALYRNEYKQAGEALLQALSSGIYLAIMMTGSLEVVLASVLIQALISLYQAREEWSNGRMPEAFAKTIMGMVRLFQAHNQVQMIQRRNVLLERYQEVAQRIHKARAISHLWNHPSIEAAYGQKGTTLEDGNGNTYDFGTNFHGQGKQIVKGMNVTFKDHGDQTSLDFKVNHVFRDRLEKTIENLSSYSQDDLKDLLQILGSHATNITITTQPSGLDNFMGLTENYVINLEGLGKISLGASKEAITLYDKISIKMEKGKNLYDFHEALSFLNLDDALRQSANEDVERMKMGQLFRTFDPKAATPFERSDRFFDLSMEEFKKEIFALSPEMRIVFEKYLPKMEEREIGPGIKRFAINGLADELKARGARGLTAAMTGIWTEQELLERTASILKMGMLSSEMRNDHQVGRQGLSAGADYFTGGADSVFTQLVTDKNKSYDEFMYHSKVRLLFSPKLLETGTYQYHDDSFGTRILNNDFWWFFGDYQNRENIFDFLANERRDFQGDHEVMIKHWIMSQYITGINVETAQLKQSMLDYLRECNIVQRDVNGNETIFSKPADQFIHVGMDIMDEQFT